MPAGRPSSYTEQKANAICDKIAEGQALSTICKADDMPSTVTVFKWLQDFPEFLNKYTRAREVQADKMAEEILQIADDGINDTYTNDDGVEFTNHDVIARSRLRVDARKWLASKLAPKKYGDKVDLSVGGNGSPVAVRIERVIVEPNSNPDS